MDAEKMSMGVKYFWLKTCIISDLSNSFDDHNDLRLTLSEGWPKSAANAQKEYREEKNSKSCQESY
ncbi:MAG: hypothetical protein ACJ0K4_13110 [Verrucomicrobiales bacterium]|nr:MAG: hypothetical protein EVB09_05515 [Verrucomicrobiaceae bacterium]